MANDILFGSSVAIRIQEPAGCRIIVSAFQIVQSCFLVVHITTIPQWIECSHPTTDLQVVAPRVVGIVCDLISRSVFNTDDIALQVRHIVVRCIIVGYCKRNTASSSAGSAAPIIDAKPTSGRTVQEPEAGTAQDRDQNARTKVSVTRP